MTTRRLTSRKVVLTATFLALAAGGAAACDAPADDDYDAAPAPEITTVSTTTPTTTPTTRPSTRVPKPRASRTTPPPPVEDAFYCADGDGVVVEEYYCDPDDGYDGSSYFLWHSTRYQRGYEFGTLLPSGGEQVAPDDVAARRAAGLPSTGVIGNGSIKTNIVGARSGSSGGSSSGGSSSGGDDDFGSVSAGG